MQGFKKISFVIIPGSLGVRIKKWEYLEVRKCHFHTRHMHLPFSYMTLIAHTWILPGSFLCFSYVIKSNSAEFFTVFGLQSVVVSRSDIKILGKMSQMAFAILKNAGNLMMKAYDAGTVKTWRHITVSQSICTQFRPV